MFDMFKFITLIPHQFVAIHSFYFKEIGYYYFRIVAQSPVASHREVIMMNILDAPCYPPAVSKVQNVMSSLAKV